MFDEIFNLKSFCRQTFVELLVKQLANSLPLEVKSEYHKYYFKETFLN